ncbi:MAG: BON domain-containing protein [Caldilinea sp.]|nr:BON domain-containing protein [Caldilinea sp.]MDW8440972.1 BON domain-containing protein [Caldilineaceae bacterium]
MKIPFIGKSGPNFADDRLQATAREALTEDPMIHDPDIFTVESVKGVIHLRGVVHSEAEKRRIETVIINALQTKGLKFDRIINELRVVN